MNGRSHSVKVQDLRSFAPSFSSLPLRGDVTAEVGTYLIGRLHRSPSSGAGRAMDRKSDLLQHDFSPKKKIKLHQHQMAELPTDQQTLLLLDLPRKHLSPDFTEVWPPYFEYQNKRPCQHCC